MPSDSPATKDGGLRWREATGEGTHRLERLRLTTTTDIKNGVQRLTKLLIRCLCEHIKGTGALELPLVVALAMASLPAAVVNPRAGARLRQVRRAVGEVAHLGEAVRPAIRPLRDADTQALGAVLARRRQVVDILVTEKNRLGRATAEVRPHIEAHISWLKRELDDLDTDLRPQDTA